MGVVRLRASDFVASVAGKSRRGRGRVAAGGKGNSEVVFAKDGGITIQNQTSGVFFPANDLIELGMCIYAAAELYSDSSDVLTSFGLPKLKLDVEEDGDYLVIPVKDLLSRSHEYAAWSKSGKEFAKYFPKKV